MQPQYEMDLQGEMDLQYEVDSQPENESEDEMESQDKINEIEMQDEIESEDQMEAQDEVEMQSAIEDIEKDYIVRENDNSNNYSDNDSITGKDVIVDAPMSMNTNESASYFENLTFAKMFCWIQKHNISTSAYNDLVEILQNPAFKADNVKPCYYLSIYDIIWNVLNNPSLYNTMYFGPGVEVEEKKEYWHSDLWAESPLFGQDKIIIDRECYHPGEFIIYKEDNKQRFGQIRSIISINNELQIKIQRIYEYNELPTKFYSNVRSATQETQLCIITGLHIKEILYKSNGYWKLRNVDLDYMYPSEYSTLIAPPFQYNNLEVLKLFIDIYYDDFGTYWNAYHSLDGVYIQIGNMPFDVRKSLRNHFVLGFVPFGGNFDDFIHPFVSDMKQLEQGVPINIQGCDHWVIASLGCTIADLPQGNDLVGVKRHSAIKGCRTCLIAKENSTDENLDIAKISRYHYSTNDYTTKWHCQKIWSAKFFSNT
ncbi:hypothetical protein C2G38_2255935 [Gigaspora rosea]|uniref:Uncharacterized protein n=1 Tax=Gigaspora rosea TaxID=44941 RepID=A0A397TV24_9GLOM|nr:hypothetical protein C2G38_2255935 [Gigaspora rosea]